MDDVERALELAWKEYAEACTEHDLPHAQHAAEWIGRLSLLTGREEAPIFGPQTKNMS